VIDLKDKLLLIFYVIYLISVALSYKLLIFKMTSKYKLKNLLKL